MTFRAKVIVLSLCAAVREATVTACLAKFQAIGDELVAGTLDADGLYPARDALLREVKACQQL